MFVKDVSKFIKIWGKKKKKSYPCFSCLSILLKEPPELVQKYKI